MAQRQRLCKACQEHLAILIQPPARQCSWLAAVGELGGGLKRSPRLFGPQPDTRDLQIVTQLLEHVEQQPLCIDRASEDIVHFVDAQDA